MNSVFNTNPDYLSSKIFNPQRPRIGANTYLNVNVLPDFVQYIKKNLTSQQLISLSQYQLQTYIMQLSIKQKVTDSFEKFVQKIISYIRSRKQFWLNEKIVKNQQNQQKQKQQQKHQHQAIRQYQKDIEFINSKIPSHQEKIFWNCKKRRIPQLLINDNIEFMDKGKQILKANLTNYSMMPTYILKTYLEYKNKQILCVQYQKLPKQQKKMLNALQNTCQYFLMIQKPRSLKPQLAKRRQSARSRNLPSYLQNKDHLHVLSQIQQSSCQKQSLNALNPFNPQPNHQLYSSSNQQYSDQQNQFYHNFHTLIQKKTYFDSKMFMKQFLINQSHNILQIMKCLIYLINNQEDVWFENSWKELEIQRIMKEKKRKQQDEDEDVQQEDDQQDQQEKNQGEQNKILQQGNKKQQNADKSLNQQENKQLEGQQKSYVTQKRFNKQQPIQSQKQNKVQNPDNQNSLSSSQKMDIQEVNQKIPYQQQIIQIGIKKPIFDQSWKNPSYSWRALSKNLSDKILSIRQIYFITKQFIKKDILKQVSQQRQLFNHQQDKSKSFENSLVSPEVSLDDIYLQYKQMIEHPQNVKLSSFKTQGITIPWDETDYLLFLKGLLDFFFVPTNNRKIAQYMMSKGSKKNIESNHVKFVKGIYLKNMNTRIDRGQSGGGKKGRMLGKLEFLEKDIQFFSMRWFDKIKKSKKKKLRRKMFDEDDDAADDKDSAY